MLTIVTSSSDIAWLNAILGAAWRQRGISRIIIMLFVDLQ